MNRIGWTAMTMIRSMRFVKRKTTRIHFQRVERVRMDKDVLQGIASEYGYLDLWPKGSLTPWCYPRRGLVLCCVLTWRIQVCLGIG